MPRLMLVGALLLAAVVARAQASDEAAAQALDDERPPPVVLPEPPKRASSELCFYARDLGRCATFWIVEASLLAGERFRTAYRFGMMKNTSFDWALGAAIFLEPQPLVGGGFLGSRGGVRPRLRYWLDDEASFEGALGAILWSADDRDDSARLGPSLTLSLRPTEAIGVTVQLDAFPYAGGADGDDGVLELYGGITLGAEAGAIGIAAIFVTGILGLFGVIGSG